MVCPRCKSKTEIKNEVEGPWFTVMTRVCTATGCVLHSGFHTIEAVTGHEVFRGVIEMAEREALAAQKARREAGERERATVEPSASSAAEGVAPSQVIPSASEVKLNRAAPSHDHPWRRAIREAAQRKIEAQTPREEHLSAPPEGEGN